MPNHGFTKARFRNRQVERTAELNLESAGTGDKLVIPVIVPCVMLLEWGFQYQDAGPTTADGATLGVMSLDHIRANIAANNANYGTSISSATRYEVDTLTVEEDKAQYSLTKASLNSNDGENLEILDFPKAYMGDQIVIELKTAGSGDGDQNIIAYVKYREEFDWYDDEVDGPELVS